MDLHESDERYIVSIPGLSSCWSQGKTEEEVFSNIETAIRVYFKTGDDLLEHEEVCEIELVE
ncbi:MAG: type II toxin-antitoxin system HicB family antitoxin [Gemmatimonadetes bacterium]|nr:type II toxin-antitoxin system HicB family antitoxin [Gemmatimonadota bacterium]